MSDDAGSDDSGQAADRPQDPLVERLRPDPSRPAEPTRTLAGLLGDSDRPGMRRLYFTAELDFYAEFRSDDVLAIAEIPPDQAPFLGEPATRVTLRRDATVEFTRTERARPLDPFDLDVRFAPGAAGPGGGGPITFGEPGCLETNGFGCQETGTIATFTCPTQFGQTCGPTCGFTCFGTCGPTCGPTCHCGTGIRCTVNIRCIGQTVDCQLATAVTCETQCQTACGTCQTQCQQATCATCATQCGTCQTHCQQATCHTCETQCATCNPHVFTCGNRCLPQ
jgi:hypothetical protein